jgi:ribonuclease Z
MHLFYDGEGILFDCGEGSQRQLSFAGINRNDIKKILITHWHADHVGGLLPIIQSMSDPNRKVTVDIYGPVETKVRLQHLLDATYFDQKLTINVHEMEPTKKCVVICDEAAYQIMAVSVEHSIPTIAYASVEKDRRRIKVAVAQKLDIQPGPIMADFVAGKDVKIKGKLVKSDEITTIVSGKKLTYIMDTAFCNQAVDLARDSDLLVCEATYEKDQEEKANEHKHLTSEQAAQIAALSNSKKLLLTHVSQRYKTMNALLEQAKDVFSDTELGYDLMSVKI